MTTQKLIVTQGIPASGKSTWARQEALNDPDGTVIVEKDSIRNMLGKYWVDGREPLVEEMHLNCVILALREGYNVIVDGTNLHQKHIPMWEDLAEDHGVNFEVKRFDVDLQTAINRDKARGSKVGEEIIRNYYAALFNDENNQYKRYFRNFGDN